MRDVPPCDTAHLINNHTNSFACAFHCWADIPKCSRIPQFRAQLGSFPTAKLIFPAAALAWPSLERVEHNMISFGQILLLDVGLFYLKFWGDVCASPLHINFLLSTRSHVCCYKVRKNGFISSDIGYSVVFSCRQVIFTKICFFLSLRKGYFTHFMPATTSAIKGF